MYRSGVFVSPLFSATKTVIPYQLRVFIQRLDNFSGQLRSHIFGRCDKPRNRRKLTLVRQYLANLRNRLVMEVIFQAAVLRRIPLISPRLMIVSLAASSAWSRPVLVLRITETRFDVLPSP